MERLLPLLVALPPVHLVGGAVRDLLLDEEVVDLDLAMEGDAVGAAQELADMLDGRAVRHERFGTATVTAGDGLSFDLAATRRETYPKPGALPKVQPAPLEEDLGRRDFAVNAIAVGLSGDDLGHLRDPLGGVDDLEQGVLRVLHERSFVDDPTRILRGARYEARLDFGLDSDSETLAREAVADDALGTVSTERVAHELLRLLAETEAGKAVDRLGDLGVDVALHPELHAEGELVAAAELGRAGDRRRPRPGGPGRAGRPLAVAARGLDRHAGARRRPARGRGAGRAHRPAAGGRAGPADAALGDPRAAAP